MIMIENCKKLYILLYYFKLGVLLRLSFYLISIIFNRKYGLKYSDFISKDSENNYFLK